MERRPRGRNLPNRGPGEYLALAEHAEMAANNFAGVEGEVIRGCWLAIAREYRLLAAKKLMHAQEGRDLTT
jgi:hypothetical protein